jgi:hypothetical protein
MDIEEGKDMAWWVFLQDTNGSRRFVGFPYSFEDEESANDRIDKILSPQGKPHKVDYWAVQFAGNEADIRQQYKIEG